MQTNLFRIPKTKVAHLQKLGIRLGVSIDVFGEERLTVAGADSQDQVIGNLQMLQDVGYLNDPGIGAIAVLHKGNIAQAERTYDFFNELRISYRILPLDAAGRDIAPPRFRHLIISNEEKVAALKRVAHRHTRMNKGIRVLPLDEYADTARRHLTGITVSPYSLPEGEWALIINTNGDAFNSGDAYHPGGYMGNIFRQPQSEIFASDAYAGTAARRRERMVTCQACGFRNACSRIPIAEMYASERQFDEDGALRCAVAYPLISHYVERLGSPGAGLMVREALWAMTTVLADDIF